MPFGLVANPLDEKLSVGELPTIRDSRGRLGLAGVEAQQRRDGGDHVRHGKGVGATAHDVGAIKLYGGKAHAALCLANARFHERLEQRLHGAARRAVRRRPEGQERRARRRRVQEVRLEGVCVTDAT